jgi:starch synthase
MLTAINNAITVYYKPDEWADLVRKAMGENFSWRKSSEMYYNYYKQLHGI